MINFNYSFRRRLSIARIKARKTRSLAEKFAAVFKRRRQSGDERRTISAIQESLGKFRRLVTRTREDERRGECLSFARAERKSRVNSPPFRPQASRCSRRG